MLKTFLSHGKPVSQLLPFQSVLHFSQCHPGILRVVLTAMSRPVTIDKDNRI